MPPKRQRSTRGQSKKSTNAEANQVTTDDTKPPLDPSSSGNELPSDPLATPLEPVTAVNTTNPAPTNSDTVQTPENRQDAAASSTAATRGRKVVSKPRGSGRRSQARLQELQKVQDENKKTGVEIRAAGEASSFRREGKRREDAQSRGRGIGGRGRGRGGYVGGGVREPIQAVASGPFGASQAAQASKPKKRSETGGQTARVTSAARTKAGASSAASSNGRSAVSNTAEDGKVVKVESAASQPVVGTRDGDGDVSMIERPRIYPEDGGYISSDEDEEEKAIQRLNVEELGIVDLTQDSNDYDIFAPVRVTRIAHKARALGINADGATNQDGVITIDANDTATTSFPEKRKTKTRPREMEATEEKQSFQATYSDSDSDDPSRSRIKRDPEAQQPSGAPISSADVGKDPPSSPDAHRKAKGKLKARNELLADDGDFHTRDELEEWERHQHDLNVLRDELGVPATNKIDQDGDASMADVDKRADKVYVFQFPPIMPELLPVTIKPEPDTLPEAPEPAAMDGPAPLAAGTDASATNTPPTLPSGLVGKLRVHASGRVTLDWGGTNLSLGMGTEATFLQDVLVATLSESKGEDEGVSSGMAMSMGQVKGKFVVTPDWDEILR